MIEREDVAGAGRTLIDDGLVITVLRLLHRNAAIARGNDVQLDALVLWRPDAKFAPPVTEQPRAQVDAEWMFRWCEGRCGPIHAHSPGTRRPEAAVSDSRTTCGRAVEWE